MSTFVPKFSPSLLSLRPSRLLGIYDVVCPFLSRPSEADGFPPFSHLSLLCVIGKGSSADKRVLIDYNVGILHDALLQVFRV